MNVFSRLSTRNCYAWPSWCFFHKGLPRYKYEMAYRIALSLLFICFLAPLQDLVFEVGREGHPGALAMSLIYMGLQRYGSFNFWENHWGLTATSYCIYQLMVPF